MTDVDLDERITALEENTDGSSQNGKIFKLKSTKVGTDSMTFFWNYLYFGIKFW